MKIIILISLFGSIIFNPLYARSCQRLMAMEMFKLSGKMVISKNKKDPFKGIILRKRFRKIKDSKAFFKDVLRNGIKGDEVTTFLNGIPSQKRKYAKGVIQKLAKHNAYCFVPKNKKPLMFVSLEDLTEAIEEGLYDRVFKAKGI